MTEDELIARWAPTLHTSYPHRVNPPTPAALAPPSPVERDLAFTTTIGDKTFVTARAGAVTTAELRSPTLNEIAEERMLFMEGRFVGAEQANRNGAMWSAGDLQLAAEHTVAHGPLNWLHEGRHIIGSIVSAAYVNPGTTPVTGGSGQGVQIAEITQPHITAKAGIWRWIYPDEAYVVQQASDAGHLWYSMECISKEVSCAGDNGCGATSSYGDYLAGRACDHIQERSSTRLFKDPIFLGGAVIVPPTRPGWAEANASVLKTAAPLAEAAFDQAGHPDDKAGEWEQMMTQLVTYAQSS